MLDFFSTHLNLKKAESATFSLCVTSIMRFNFEHVWNVVFGPK